MMQKTEILEERVKCSNDDCSVIVRKDTAYRVNGRPYCQDCYIFESMVNNNVSEHTHG